MAAQPLVSVVSLGSQPAPKKAFAPNAALLLLPWGWGQGSISWGSGWELASILPVAPLSVARL